MNRILVALDVDSAAKAVALADALRGSVGGFKIGKQLFTAEGPSMVRTLAERGDRVFLDLKFHDIPNTVAGAVASAAATGAWMVNVHASGGRRMMQAAAESAKAPSERLGRPRPLVIAVTVLTSLEEQQLREVGVDSADDRPGRRARPAGAGSRPRRRRRVAAGDRRPSGAACGHGVSDRDARHPGSQKTQTAQRPRGGRSGTDDDAGRGDRARARRTW